MLVEAVADRYAEALFQLATEQGQRAETERELTVACSMLASQPALGRALQSPEVPVEVKRSIVGQVFATGFSTLVANFIHLLVDRQRIGMLEAIASTFHRLHDQAENRIDVEVCVAVEMPREVHQAVQSRLTEATGHVVSVQWRVDPEILGGVVVRIRDHLIDYSLKAQLQELRERLVRVHA